MHSITGCDTTYSLNRLGKKTAYITLLKKNLNSCTTCHLLHIHAADDTVYVSLARMLVLLMYVKKNKGVASLNDLRNLFATITNKAAALFLQKRMRSNNAFSEQDNSAWFGVKATLLIQIPVGHGWSTVWVKPPPPEVFWHIFSQTVGNFRPNFVHIL